MLSSKSLPERGTYTLIISLKKGGRMGVGRLGQFMFRKGYYAYTGSALSNLPHRIRRHYAKRKNRHWHIDFLLTTNADITSAVVAPTAHRQECNINQMIKNVRNAMIPVFGFGASDCRLHCGSHLVYFGGMNPHRNVVAAYVSLFGAAATLIVSDCR